MIPETAKLAIATCDVAVVVTVPAASVEISLAPMLTLAAKLEAPLTETLVSVPTEVTFGCAAVYTVPETSAFAT